MCRIHVSGNRQKCLTVNANEVTAAGTGAGYGAKCDLQAGGGHHAKGTFVAWFAKCATPKEFTRE